MLVKRYKYLEKIRSFYEVDLSTKYQLKMTGGDIKSVQGDTGHAEAEMVTDVYSEIVDKDRRLNAQKMEEDFYKDSTEEKVDNSTEMLLNALKKLSADDRARLLKELG